MARQVGVRPYSTEETRTFAEGIVPYVMPEWYGAMGDGITDDAAAFNLMFASGHHQFELAPDANYLIKDVALPPINGFRLYGNGATIVPDNSAGVPATCFTATLITDVRYFIIEDLFLAGDVTDFIHITQTGVNGYMMYWQFKDIRALSGAGTSLVKITIDNVSQPECLYFHGIMSQAPALFDHILFLTHTGGSAVFGSIDCRDVFQNQNASVGQSVIYSDIAGGGAINCGTFDMIFGTRGHVIDLTGANHSRFSRILMEVVENNCEVIAGLYINCWVDGLYLVNSTGVVGDKLFVGSMEGCSVKNTWHYRAGGLGANISVNLDAASHDNYWNDLFDAVGNDYRHWVSLQDLGQNNTLNELYGTWTPVDASGAALVLTIGGQSTYTKIGNAIWASCQITFPATADATNVKIGGLPFNLANNIGNAGGGQVTYCNVATGVTVYPIPNTKTVYFYKIGGTQYINSEFSGKVIMFSVLYQQLK